MSNPHRPSKARVAAPRHVVAFAALLVLVCAACAAPAPSPSLEPSSSPAAPAPSPSLERSGPPATLAGSAWTAVLVDGQPVVVASPPTAAFDATTIRGSTGCNGYNGDYRYDAGMIAIGDTMSTLIGCDGAIGTTEQRFMAALGAATTVSMDPEGRLMLDGPNGSIVFVVAGR